MEMISKGKISDHQKFNFENNNFDGTIEYYNGTLYWVFFDEKGNEAGRENLFDIFNIQSTMVADFELIERDIKELPELTSNINYDTYSIENNRHKINELVRAVNKMRKIKKEE